MKLEELYKLAVEVGIKNDPRGTEEPNKLLSKTKKKFEKMDEKDKPFFDKDKLWNPYADTRIQNGPNDAEVKKILVGVDIDTSEVLLADQLNERGAKIDAVVSHHPGGPGSIGLSELMLIQTGLLSLSGVSLNVAEDLVIPRAAEVGDRIYPANHYKTANAARLLKMPLMSVHSPADNCVQSYLQKELDKEKPETIGDLVDFIHSIPEYHLARLKGLPAKIENGNRERLCGKIRVSMTGGTTGNIGIYKELKEQGVGTWVVMHIPPEHVTEAKKHHINVVNVG
ncbi:MAG: NGG1p interacting factor NIF3, partial [Caldisericia bacterium]